MPPDAPLFDLSKFSFDEFVSFFFDHDESEEYWFFDDDYYDWDTFTDRDTADPSIVVAHMTKLFTNFAEIATRFSLPQINTGIWAMFTDGGSFRLHKHLWLPAVPVGQRAECIRSMYFVYSTFVARSTVEEMENCFEMWWDELATGFWSQLRYENAVAEGDVGSISADYKIMLEAMLQTLRDILALPDRRTQRFALHGLGHLHHPEVHHVVQKWIDENRQRLTEEELRWVESCRTGTVM